jgi:P2 family phage contractile tail tube protein
MAQRRIPAVIRDISIFVDGHGFLGQSESLKLPPIKTKKEFIMGQWVDTRMLEQMEVDLEIRNLSQIMFQSMGTGEVTFKCKGGFFENGADKRAIATIGGSLDVDMDTWKMTDGLKTKIKVYVSTLHLELDGEEVLDIDTRNEIAKIGGIDIYQTLRNSIQ